MSYNKKQARKLLTDAGIFDTLGTNKNGNLIGRSEFFYTHGRTSEKYAAAVTALGLKVIGHGEVWKPFRGGASTAQSSHFWVEIAPEVTE